MNLRIQAAADLLSILGDVTGGFGWAITLTSPEGVVVALSGLSTDIHQTIDPETGMTVSGRRASVSVPLALIEAAYGAGNLPRAIASSASKPWVVRFADILGHAHVFKVQESMPDRAIGNLVLMLETYIPPAV